MTGPDAIREALAAAIQVALGDEIQASAKMLADPTPPAAHVFPGPIRPHQAFQRGLTKDTYIVEVFVAEVLAEGAQAILDRYLEEEGPTSVFEAIEADTSLGGLVDDVTVTDISGYRRYLRAQGEPVLGAAWTVEILKS